jgi:hypothetical protein
MIKYIGNTNHLIDWQKIIDELEFQTPSYVGPRHSENDPIIGIQEMSKLWKNAGFELIKDGGTAGWDMFFPGKNFDNSIVEIFSNFVNKKVIDCWISRVNPGNMTPWHWDCNDKEDEYSKMNIVRYSCSISNPSFGHAIMVENECLYYKDQGDVFEWPSRTCWHGGVNCGFKPKYMLNFSGVNV